MKTPQFPLFEVSQNQWYCDIVNAPHELSNWTTLAVIKFVPDSSVYFDSNNNQWIIKNLSITRELNWIDGLLANTIYNPIIPVQIIWSHKGKYELNELKKALIDCVETDDDILTQFVDNEFLIKKIKDCTEFNNLLDVFERYVINFDENSIER